MDSAARRSLFYWIANHQLLPYDASPLTNALEIDFARALMLVAYSAGKQLLSTNTISAFRTTECGNGVQCIKNKRQQT